ncbi:MAG: type I DNA topoisomerase [bacterium]|nr:type I DNA topoisomerase [bacterium]
MKQKLVIVESPSKSKTIGGYLGNEYLVTSSKGHIRDLTTTGKGGLGIDIEHNFKPIYAIIPDKKTLVKELIEASKQASEIYLATDPDREGEAISWHLAEVLDVAKKPVYRVFFNEITKKAILEAFEHPGQINEHLVFSQEARRVIDRIIGFKLSKLLQSKIKSKSAGRVQSACLKLIVDKEREINAFVIEEYYEVKAVFDTFEADLFKIQGKTPALKTREQTMSLIEQLKGRFVVSSLETKHKSSESKPPFITSTFMQEASSKLGYNSTKTMEIAQKLYEGIEIGNENVGLITYMRTDSIRLSEDFVTSANRYIVTHYSKDYLGHPKMMKSNTGNMQDAHEAIRPTDIFRTPDSMKSYLTKEQQAIYQLIYARALASLMKASTYDQTILVLENGETLFKAIQNKPDFDGYLKVYGKYDAGTTKSKDQLPNLTVGDYILANSVLEKQCFTNPPMRYSESKLIKEMEELGIGRPSTYASTILLLKKRKYISESDKKFVPSDQGMLTIDALEEFFKEFISADYSKDMEDVLDQIAEGSKEPVDVVRSFYEYFNPIVVNASRDMKKIPPTQTGEPCPLCGKPMVHRKGKYGEFEGCSDYPTCRYIKKAVELDAPKLRDTLVACPTCPTGTLVERIAARGKNKGNRFLACSSFPKCKYVHPYTPIDIDCPKCGNLLVKNNEGHIFCVDEQGCGYHQH